jgi:hypothetical protein
LRVIADLLGCAHEDRGELIERLRRGQPTGAGWATREVTEQDAAGYLYEHLRDVRRRTVAQSSRRRARPGWRPATFPDGSVAEVGDVVRSPPTSFSAGQETTGAAAGHGVEGDR